MPSSPLQSGINRSDRGNDYSAIRDRERIAGHMADQGRLFASPSGAAMVLRGYYPAFEGEVANGPHLRIGLCMDGAATLAQDVAGHRLEGRWRRGSIVVTPADGKGVSRCSPVDMIGLAVLPSLSISDQGFGGELGSRFYDDSLMAAVMTALHYEAEVHGASTAFFEHGVALIAKRFAELEFRKPEALRARPLSSSKLERVRCYVDSRLAEDISVVELAAVVGMDPSGFTRALRERSGLPPYAWLTQRRMERACEYLAVGWKVTRIAHALGFSNSSKFSAAFRRVVGTSPSEWRARRLL